MEQIINRLARQHRYISTIYATNRHLSNQTHASARMIANLRKPTQKKVQHRLVYLIHGNNIACPRNGLAMPIHFDDLCHEYAFIPSNSCWRASLSAGYHHNNVGASYDTVGIQKSELRLELVKHQNECQLATLKNYPPRVRRNND